MKRNISIIVLAVVSCISLAISGITIALAVDNKETIDWIVRTDDNVYGCQYIDAEFEKIREEIDQSEYNYELGDRTIWYPGEVRQAQVEISGDTLTIPAGKHVKVLFAHNMSISPDNEDFSKDRQYSFIDPNEDGYIVVAGVETGVAIINVIRW